MSRSAFLYQKRWHLCTLLCNIVKMNQFYETASFKNDIVVWKTFQFMWRDTICDDVNSFSLLLSVSTNVRMKDFENDTANIILCWKPFNARSSVICMIIVWKKNSKLKFVMWYTFYKSGVFLCCTCKSWFIFQKINLSSRYKYLIINLWFPTFMYVYLSF